METDAGRHPARLIADEDDRALVRIHLPGELVVEDWVEAHQVSPRLEPHDCDKL